mmetsp:Transcript_95761/g.247972  ORF Transcript_95761/g.247972 Transcript_95761/m.247972 type:complete len:255 (-) Transcript_95761:17-781(-)
MNKPPSGTGGDRTSWPPNDCMGLARAAASGGAATVTPSGTGPPCKASGFTESEPMQPPAEARPELFPKAERRNISGELERTGEIARAGRMAGGDIWRIGRTAAGDTARVRTTGDIDLWKKPEFPPIGNEAEPTISVAEPAIRGTPKESQRIGDGCTPPTGPPPAAWGNAPMPLPNAGGGGDGDDPATAAGALNCSGPGIADGQPELAPKTKGGTGGTRPWAVDMREADMDYGSRGLRPEDALFRVGRGRHGGGA